MMRAKESTFVKLERKLGVSGERCKEAPGESVLDIEDGPKSGR